jgi:hypothetical protein
VQVKKDNRRVELIFAKNSAKLFCRPCENLKIDVTFLRAFAHWKLSKSLKLRDLTVSTALDTVGRLAIRTI